MKDAGEELNRGGLGVERNEDLCDCRCGDGAGAEDRLAGSRAAAGGWWLALEPGSSRGEPAQRHSTRGCLEPPRGDEGEDKDRNPGPWVRLGKLACCCRPGGTQIVLGCHLPFQVMHRGCVFGMKSQRVCGQQRILPVVSGRAAPSRKAPSSMSPSVISSKLHQCKRPCALCLSVTSV